MKTLNSLNFFKKNNISILDIKITKIFMQIRAKLRTYEYLIINRQGVYLSIEIERGM